MNSLPSEWINIRLEEIALFLIGGDWGHEPSSKKEGYALAKVIRGNDFKIWTRVRASNSTIRLIKNSSLEKRRLEVGDIVVEVSGGGPDQPVGRTILIDEAAVLSEKYPLICSNFFRKIKLSKLVDAKYVQYCLDYAYISGQLDNMQSHTTNLRNLKVPEFLKLKIPLPPQNEQALISERIDTILGQLIKSRERIEKIPVVLNNIIQLVLAAAVNGELTEDWRKNRIKPENSLDLLNSVLEHRKIEYEKALAHAKKNKQPVPRPLKINLNKIDSTEFHGIPENWVWTRLLNVADIISGVTKGRNLSDKKTIEVPYLRVANVQNGYLDLREVKTIEVLPSDVDKYKLIKNDILFTEGGDRDKLGRGTIWNDEIPNCIHQNHIIRARVPENLINPGYISYFTKTKIALEYFYNNANQTVNLASISLTTLSNVPIALPPYEEQNEIVRRIQSYLRIIDSLRNKYDNLTFSFDNAKRLLYEKAFTGQIAKAQKFEFRKEELQKLLLEEQKRYKSAIHLSSNPSKIKRKIKKIDPMEILQALETNGGSLSPIELWKATKYADNIEDFYAALKVEMEYNKTIRESEDKSLIQLVTYEN